MSCVLHPAGWFNLGCDRLPMFQDMLVCHGHVSPAVTVHERPAAS